MFDGIFFAIGVFLAITGLIGLLFMLMLRFSEPRRREKYDVILRLYEDNDPSAVISSALEKRNLLGESALCKIIAVNCGLSRESLDFLHNMYGKIPMFVLIEPTELSSVLSFNHIG